MNPKVNFFRLLDYLKTRLSTSDNNKNYIQDCVPLVLLTATPERECWGYVYVGSWPSSQKYLSNALPSFGLGVALTGSVGFHCLFAFNSRQLQGDGISYFSDDVPCHEE